jgi:signal transduction histidine kinase
MSAPGRQSWSWPVAAALVAAVLLLALGVMMARYEDGLYVAQEQRDLGEQAQILAASVTAAIQFDDAEAAREYVAALQVNPQLLAAGVYGQRGRSLAGFVRPGAAPLPATPPEPGIAFAEGTMTIAVPVSENGDNLGTVILRANTEPLQRRITRYAGLVLLVTMGALVILVLSVSQTALIRRARQLLEVNDRLHSEMAERQKTEEALRQSQKMEAIGQLSGGIAHDFNNLIMIAKGNLRLLRRKLGDAAAGAGHHIDQADEALDRATNLTQRVLAFSRRQPLSPQPVQLSQLIAGMADLLRHSAGEKVAIATRLDANGWIYCDVNQMENVILNLAINARDAMPGGGTLTISTNDAFIAQAPPEAADFVPGAYVVLSIRDNGEGMSEEVRRRALDPFFTTKPLGKGTGLGLSMTFGFVRQSNGYLTIQSAPGAGTDVVIYMPRHAEVES